MTETSSRKPNRTTPKIAPNRRNPAALLETLVAITKRQHQIKNTEQARLYLGSALRRKTPEPWAVALVAQHGISVKYVVHHLLSIGSWDQSIRDAVKAGLALPSARKVAVFAKEHEHNHDLIQQALEPFWTESAWTNARRSAEVERAVLRLNVRHHYDLDEQGWLPPHESPEGFTAPLTEAWLFYPLNTSAIEREALHPWIAKAIVSSYSRIGDRVLDPFAGTGVIADAAHTLGRWSFSSDLYPFGAQHIHELDITDLERKLEGVRANLVIVHPPSVRIWGSETAQIPSDYGEWLGDVVGICAGILEQKGYLILVVQPGVQAEHWMMPILQGFADTGLQIVKLQLAISTDSSEQWCILVGLNPTN